LILFLITSLFGAYVPPTSPTKTEVVQETLRGSHTFGTETLQQLTSEGILKLHGTKVIQKLRLDGTLLAESAHIGYLEVFGEANLTNSTVDQGSTIIGYLRAQGSLFLAPLILGAQKAVFTSSRLVNITVRKEEAFKGKQIIELKQHTIVDGNIVFESGKGEVHLYGGSQIFGSVTGGKIIKKN